MKREEVLAILDELIDVPVIECMEDQELVDGAKRAREFIASALEDAERYRWLKDSLYRQWFEVGEAEIGMRVVGACPTPEQVDTAIDTARASAAGGEAA